MDPRHAAALALVGWYLMIPPVREARSPTLKGFPHFDPTFGEHFS